MADGIPVTIVRVEPEAEYEGTVYDQSVIIELSDGSRMGVFDKDMIVEGDIIGKDAIIVISTLTNASCIEQTTNKESGIEPSSEEPLFWDNHIYRGDIKNICSSGQKTYTILLNVGVGDVIVRLNKDQFSNLEVSDPLQVTATRSDVYSVEIAD